MTYRKREVHTHWESAASVRTLVTGRRHIALVHYCTPALRVLHGSRRHSVYHDLSSSAIRSDLERQTVFGGSCRHAVITISICLAIKVQSPFRLHVLNCLHVLKLLLCTYHPILF